MPKKPPPLRARYEEEDEAPSKASSFDRTLGIIATLLVLGVLVWFGRGFLPETGSKYPVVGRITPQGGLRIRPPRTLQWRDVEGDADVHLWDTVHTGSDGGAIVRLTSGEIITIDPNTMVLFREFGSSFDLLVVKGRVVAPQTIAVEQRGAAPIAPPAVLRELPALTARVQSLGRREIPPPPSRVPQLPTAQYVLSDFQIRLVAPRAFGGKRTVELNRWNDFRWSRVPLEGVQYRLQLKPKSKTARYVDYPTSKHSLSVQVGAPGLYDVSVEARLGRDIITSPPERLVVTENGRDIATKN
jgi:hypothetical protein